MTATYARQASTARPRRDTAVRPSRMPVPAPAANACACGGSCPRCSAQSSPTQTIYRTPADPGTSGPAQVAPGAWTPDYINIVVVEERGDCFGIASPGHQAPYGSCGSPVIPPFCSTARLPFKVRFFVDREDAELAGYTPPRISVAMQFTTTSGRRTLNVNQRDNSPGYRGPNRPLETRFGEDFPVGTTESGVLTMNIGMYGVNGYDVTYNDTIDFIIRPCG